MLFVMSTGFVKDSSLIDLLCLDPNSKFMFKLQYI